MDILAFRRSDPESAAASPMFAGFDAIRAFAAFGVVVLHACVPYLRHPMPGLAWPVRDTQSDLIDCLFWSIEIFIMPVFLVLAGFLAWQTLVRRGPVSLIRNRASRLLKPLAFGMIVVLPMDLYAWILGWVAEGLVPMIKLKSLKIDEPLGKDLWGLSHLWFLQYLFLYVVALAGWIAVRRRFPVRQTLLVWQHKILGYDGLPVRRETSSTTDWKSIVRIPGTLNSISDIPRRTNSNWMVGALLAVGIGTLLFRPQVVWGFQHAFQPVPSKWIYSGTFFVGGAWIAMVDPKLLWLRRHAIRMASPALLFGAAAVLMGQWHLAGGEGKAASTILAWTTVVAAWAITLSLLGNAAAIRSVSLAVKYVAAASFWIYLVHHPILGIVHIDLKWLLPGASPIVKLALAFTITTGTCLLSYEALIRKTAIGRWLGFAWSPATDGSLPDVITMDNDGREKSDFPDDPIVHPARRAA